MYIVIILDKNNRDCMLIKMTWSFCWQVTTPDDLLVAERILHQSAPQEVVKAVSSWGRTIQSRWTLLQSWRDSCELGNSCEWMLEEHCLVLIEVPNYCWISWQRVFLCLPWKYMWSPLARLHGLNPRPPVWEVPEHCAARETICIDAKTNHILQNPQCVCTHGYFWFSEPVWSLICQYWASL